MLCIAGSNDPGLVRPSTILYFVPSSPSFHITSFPVSFLLFLYAMVGKTLLLEFHIVYSHTEWNFLFTRKVIFLVLAHRFLWEASPLRLCIMIIIAILVSSVPLNGWRGELCRPASRLYPHNLSSLLETAVSGSNARYDHPDTLRRLDVKLLEVAHGDTGWDVFSLDYHVDGPIGTVRVYEYGLYLDVITY